MECNHCIVWTKKAKNLVSACFYCGRIFIIHKEYNEETDKRLIAESYGSYDYIHKKYGCIAKPWKYDAMKQRAYRKLAHL
jgi:hypothetical protein